MSVLDTSKIFVDIVKEIDTCEADGDTECEMKNAGWIAY